MSFTFEFLELDVNRFEDVGCEPLLLLVREAVERSCVRGEQTNRIIV